MEVWDGLAAVCAVVDDGAEAVWLKALFAGNFPDGEEEMPEEGVIFLGGGAEARDGFFRDEKQVGGCLGGNVAEAEALFVLVNDVCGDFAGDDFFEQSHGGKRSNGFGKKKGRTGRFLRRTP